MGVNKRASVLSGTIFTERNEKELRFIRVYDHYRRDYFKVPTTPKFYSLHDSQIHRVSQNAIKEIIENIRIAKDLGPRFKRKWPETTNQMYGWFPELLVDIDKEDCRFYFPKKETEITQFGLKALQCKKNKR
ncbi:unnamed protein product [Ceutorhynchus assimilis]|uniref:Uncharacterized protein n=1 Tax=Ceutorhynchus assimilis TaxID=467358 RepID=A0A9N9QNF6_9CUCU|nr:unnamed protein product [Ceutorhynchus assimilis]